MSAWICILELPTIAFSPHGVISSSKATQNRLTVSELAETHEQTPLFSETIRELNQPVPVEQQAKTLYETGRYAEAVKLLEPVLETYQKQDDLIRQAIILSNLARNYQQLGAWDKASPAIEQALNLLKQTPKDTPNHSAIWAQALDILANLQLAAGKTEQAVESWEQSAQLYNQLGDVTRETQSRINQAQALHLLGLYNQALLILNTVNTDLQSQPDSLAKAENLRSLGNALRGIGNLACDHPDSPLNSDCLGAAEILQQSLEIAQNLQSPAAIGAANFSLGNLAWTQGQMRRERGKAEQANCQEVNGNFAAASHFYQQAIAQSLPPLQTQAQLNYLQLLLELEQWSEAEKLYPQVQKQIANLPRGRSRIDAQVNLATHLQKLSTKNDKTGGLTTPGFQEIDQLLTAAHQDAQRLQDVRSQALVLQEQGQLYQHTQQLLLAKTLSQQTLTLSQPIQASEISYRAAWQLGRILKAQANNSEQQGDIFQAQKEYEAAIAAYTTAYEEAKSLRGRRRPITSDILFSFQESVEPLYREFADLLLQLASQTPDSNPKKQKKLKKAREVLESLQVGALQDYLQQPGQDVELNLDQLLKEAKQNGETAAVIYPMILDDRLEVMIQLPDQEQLYQSSPIALSKDEIEQSLKEFQANLRDEYKFKGVRESGKIVYDWLIRPVSQILERNDVQTLIFILDGPLRTIPMSALYDGEKFLVEKYNIALVLGLDVPHPTPLKRSQMKVLAASLTEPPPGLEQYAQLPNVNPELDEIQQAGVLASFLRDKQFTIAAFDQTLNQDSFPVVHLATHGQFGPDRDSTYLLTADGAIYVDQLSKLFRSLEKTQTKAVDLLILSACKTAAGNDRVIFGIAGTIVRAGAKSAIGSLWSLADSSGVEFTQTLYQHLGQPNTTRAEALRQAQLALLKNPNYTHPRYWAPYVLVGDWF